MRPHNKLLTKFLFLPLIAAVVIELAPSSFAASFDPVQRSGSRAGGHSSGGGRSGGSFGRSSGGSRSSGSSRSSGARRSSSSSHSSGSIGRSSSSSRSSHSSGSTARSSSSSRSNSSSHATRNAAPSRSSSSTERVRYVRPSTSTSPSASSTTPRSTGRSQAVDYRPGNSSSTTLSRSSAVGEAYVRPPARQPFPSPSTSGRTTYARRFDGGLTTGGRASATTGGTLGRNGTGSVTSAIEARRRADAASSAARVRAPQSPGARFRSRDAQTGVSSPPIASPSARDRAQSELTKRKTSARRMASYDTKQAETSARARRLMDPKAGRLVSTASDALTRATGTLVSTAMRPLTGGGASLTRGATGGLTKGRADFGGYGTGAGTGGADFGGYGDPPYYPPTSNYGYGYGYGYGNGYGYGSGYGFGYWDGYGYYHSPYSSWWGWSFGWASNWGFYAGYNWGSPYYGYGSYNPYYYSTPYYGGSYAYPTIINQYLYDDGPVGEAVVDDSSDEIIINVYPDAVEAGPGVEVNWLTGEGAPSGFTPAPGAAGAAASTAPTAAPASAGLGPAPLRYLELGDAAFAEMRFADAVHFYARSLEFEPDRGMLHLVLADALFATGDWHFAAYSIRKALQLEPNLVESPVDKHSFYADPSEFDRQIASLELYFKENPSDGDARLVLGLNQLFGGRPEAAKELLENAPTQAYGETDTAAALILQSAERARWGAKPPAEATWKP